MAHKVINDKVVVDWTTGDPEGDRTHLLAAYRDFIKEVYDEAFHTYRPEVKDVFKRWNVDTENQVDEVPRVWIKRPE